MHQSPSLPNLPGNARLFAAKSTAPQSSGQEIARTELCERIFAAGAARLVLLRAPAGFGKTTAMLQVYEHFRLTGLPVAWLTLDRADNDLARFLAALSTALGRLIPGLGPAADLSGGPDELAFAMMDRVCVHPVPFALFLDDFEALQNPAAIGIVTALIEQLPRGAQLIVGSRGVPELGLGRLRTRGRLLEVEPAQLRFSEAEVDAFLRQRRGLPLSSDDVRRLHRSTEGWAAALGLASISLENRDDPGRFIAGFTGSNAAVVAYLVEDVLARQTEDIRSFLLRTSVLSELHAPLCDAVCGRSDSTNMLQRLEQAHLFLMPLRSDHSQYRYHGMFAEFLRAELARQHAAEIPRLHRAASRWFADNGRPIAAIEHALAAGDLALALPELNCHAQSLLDDGRVRLLSRWLDPLRESGALDASPMLLVVHAWAVCFARGPRSAEPLLDQLEQRNDMEPEVRTHRLAMRALLLSLTDHVEEAVPLATEALASAPSDLAFVSGFIKVTLSILALVTGRFHDALRYADAARSPEQEVRSSPFNFALSGAAEGVVDLAQGRLRKAIAGLRIAVSTGALDDNRPTNGNALVGIQLAQALYEAGQLDQAERLLVVYIPLIRDVCIPDDLIIGHVVMARIAADRGDAERAEQMLAELEHIGHRDGLPRVVATARLERVRMLLMADRLSHARAELDRCGDRALWARVATLSLRANEVETYDLAVARWSVRSGHAAEVVRTLRTELDSAERAKRERRALTLRLVLAQALHRTDQHNKAMRMLASAVRTASAEGYVRAFLDEGTLLRALLLELRNLPDVLNVDDGCDALAFVDRLLQEPLDSAAPRPPTDASYDTAAASELLTRKELQVLRLAAEGLTNDQLAERLFVAETTVRTHLRNINVKLDTRGRVEAIAAARKLRLIG